MEKDIYITSLLLNPIYVTAFWAIVLIFPLRESNYPRKFLGYFMIMAFTLYMSHYVYFMKYHEVYIWLDAIYNFASLSIYPMFYIYVRLLTVDEVFSIGRHGRFLIAPAVIFLAIAISFTILNDADQHSYIESIIYGYETWGGTQWHLHLIMIAQRITFVTQTVLYAILTFRLVRRHNELLDERYSFTENLRISWVQVFNVTFFLTSLSSSVVAIIGREKFVDNALRLAGPSYVFSIMIFLIGLLGNRQKLVMINEQEEPESDNTTADTIPARLREDLEKLFRERKIYLKKELTIWDVTDMLATNRTYVSRIINHEYGLTFTQYVNNFRVEHAKLLMEKDNATSVDEVAEISGFGSANSLYRAFLAKEKMPLAEYRRTLKSRPKGRSEVVT